MKKILAILLAVCLLSSVMLCGAVAAEPLTLTGAYKLNDTQIKITFSEPVTFTGAYEMYLCYLNENGDLQWDGGTPLQIYYGAPGTAGVAYADAQQSLVFTLDGSRSDTLGLTSVTEALAATEPGGAYEGYILSIRIEEGSATDEDGTIAAVSALSGATPLSATHPASDARDRAIISVAAGAPRTLQISEAYLRSDTEIKVKFSEPVTFTGAYEMYLCYLNENGDLQWDGGTPLQIYYGAPGTAGVAYADAQQSLVFTLDGSRNDTLGLRSAKQAYDATQPGGQYEGYTLSVRIEEPGNDSDNLITGVAANADGLALTATHPATDANDRAIVKVSPDSPEPPAPTKPDQEPEKTDPNALTIVGAYQVSDTKIKLIFSDRIKLEGAYEMYLCYVDDSNNLQWDGDTPLQIYYGAPGTPGIAFSDYQYSLVFKIDGSRTDTLGFRSVEEAMEATRAGGKYEGMKLAVRIEEPTADGDDTIAAVSKVSDGTPLTANTPSDTERDKSFALVTTDAPPAIPDYAGDDITSGFRVLRAYAVTDTQIVVELSEAAKFAGGSGFMAIRYVDAGNNLQWDGDTPLQFTGSVLFSEDHTKLVWTLADSGNPGSAKSIFDIINFKGEYAKYEDMYAVFCIEEYTEDGKDPEDGTIENIVSYGGEKLRANKIAAGDAFDGVYTKITIDRSYVIPATADVGVAAALAGLCLSVVLCTALAVYKKRSVQ